MSMSAVGASLSSTILITEHAQDFSNLSGDFRNPEPGKPAKKTMKGRNT
jgi:hypothetical protein